MSSVITREGGDRVCKVLDGRVETVGLAEGLERTRRVGDEGVLSERRAGCL